MNRCSTCKSRLGCGPSFITTLALLGTSERPSLTRSGRMTSMNTLHQMFLSSHKYQAASNLLSILIHNHHHYLSSIQHSFPWHGSDGPPNLNTPSTTRLARSAIWWRRWCTTASVQEILTLHEAQNLYDGGVLGQMLRDVDGEIWLLSDVVLRTVVVLNRIGVVVPNRHVDVAAAGNLVDRTGEGSGHKGQDGEKNGETHFDLTRVLFRKYRSVSRRCVCVCRAPGCQVLQRVRSCFTL